MSSFTDQPWPSNAKTTGFAGVVAFANLAQELGLFDELDRWLPAKEAAKKVVPRKRKKDSG